MARDALERLEFEVRKLPMAKQAVERRRKLEAWVDAGYGSCVLREPPVAEMMESALLFFDQSRYRCLAWVVMPNHVHVLIEQIEGWTLQQVVGSWKKFTARKIREFVQVNQMRSTCPADPRANQEIGVPRERCLSTQPVWHREFWDRYIRSGEHLQKVKSYIHENPVKAGLVRRAEDWNWSSARFASGRPLAEGAGCSRAILS